jgi:hypothetical protein
MKFLAILALATAAIAATTTADVDANNMAVNGQAEAAAPLAEAAADAAADTNTAADINGDADTNSWYPPPHHRKCKPGTYSCTHDHKGWRVCDYSGRWVVSHLRSSRVVKLDIRPVDGLLTENPPNTVRRPLRLRQRLQVQPPEPQPLLRSPPPLVNRRLWPARGQKRRREESWADSWSSFSG